MNGSIEPNCVTSKTGSAVADLMMLLQKSSDSYKKLFLDHKTYGDKLGEAGSLLTNENLAAKKNDEEGIAAAASRVELLAKIREKRDVIEKLRCQPWPMQRKRRTLGLAQKYLQRYECKVSKTDMCKEEVSKKWKKISRCFANFSIYLIPWESKIKTIESMIK